MRAVEGEPGLEAIDQVEMPPLEPGVPLLASSASAVTDTATLPESAASRVFPLGSYRGRSWQSMADDAETDEEPQP